MRHKFLVFIVLCVIIAGAFIVGKNDPVESPGRSTKAAQQKVTPKSFDKTQYSSTNPASLWVVINKQHALMPKDYTPADLVFPTVLQRVPGNESMQLRQPTATALQAMFKHASADGISMMLSSGYRPYAYQVNLYNGYVKSQGQTTADTLSARPGFSEHQSGLAADIEPADRTCELELCFGDTAAGMWLTTHAYEYGFIIRYLADKQEITGYAPEPWHLRYVGTDLANEMHKTGVTTLEEFFLVNGGTTYSE